MYLVERNLKKIGLYDLIVYVTWNHNNKSNRKQINMTHDHELLASSQLRL